MDDKFYVSWDIRSIPGYVRLVEITHFGKHAAENHIDIPNEHMSTFLGALSSAEQIPREECRRG